MALAGLTTLIKAVIRGFAQYNWHFLSGFLKFFVKTHLFHVENLDTGKITKVARVISGTSFPVDICFSSP